MADAIKGTPLEGSTVYVGGSAAMYKDMQQGADYDLLIAAVASLVLIFLIMVILTRPCGGRRVIVGTVVLSPGDIASACRCCCGSTSSVSRWAGWCCR